MKMRWIWKRRRQVDATRGPASADDLESATLQHIFNFLRLDDTRQTPAGVSRKWRQASKAVVPCKDDYLETPSTSTTATSNPDQIF